MSLAKKARTSRSQQPACTHKEHQILVSAEAAAFAAQFLDRKAYPTKAHSTSFWPRALTLMWRRTSSMHMPMGSLPLWKGATMRTIWIQNSQWSLEHCSVLHIVQFAALCSKM